MLQLKISKPSGFTYIENGSSRTRCRQHNVYFFPQDKSHSMQQCRTERQRMVLNALSATCCLQNSILILNSFEQRGKNLLCLARQPLADVAIYLWSKEKKKLDNTLSLQVLVIGWYYSAFSPSPFKFSLFIWTLCFTHAYHIKRQYLKNKTFISMRFHFPVSYKCPFLQINTLSACTPSILLLSILVRRVTIFLARAYSILPSRIMEQMHIV